MDIDLSVIICTKNGSKKIEDCLVALSKQTLKKGFEVIIVDDGSNDNTIKILNKFSYKVIQSKINFGLAKSRNIGFQNARGEIIAFTDDDCIPDSDWVEKILLAFKKNSKLGGLSGCVTSYRDNNYILKYISIVKPLTPLSIELSYSKNIFYRFYLYFKNQFLFLDKFSNEKNSSKLISSVVGANMAFRKDLLVKLVGFDPIFKFGGEEEELSYRFYKSVYCTEYILKFVPNIRVKHKFEEDLYSYIKKQYLYGMGNARIKLRHHERSVSLFPYPILIIILSIFCIFFLKNYYYPIILPVLFYSQWIFYLIFKKNAIAIIFPYIQFLAELSNNIGWIVYYFYYSRRLI